MSTIYAWRDEVASLATPTTTDVMLVHDASAGKPKYITLANIAAGMRGNAATELVGFYGVTKVNQGTMTATAVTALTTNPTLSASNTGAGVFGFASSTAGAAIVTAVTEIQADLETLLGLVDSTGLVSVAGV